MEHHLSASCSMRVREAFCACNELRAALMLSSIKNKEKPARLAPWRPSLSISFFSFEKTLVQFSVTLAIFLPRDCERLPCWICTGALSSCKVSFTLSSSLSTSKILSGASLTASTKFASLITRCAPVTTKTKDRSSEGDFGHSVLYQEESIIHKSSRASW